MSKIEDFLSQFNEREANKKKKDEKIANEKELRSKQFLLEFDLWYEDILTPKVESIRKDLQKNDFSIEKRNSHQHVHHYDLVLRGAKHPVHFVADSEKCWVVVQARPGDSTEYVLKREKELNTLTEEYIEEVFLNLLKVVLSRYL